MAESNTSIQPWQAYEQAAIEDYALIGDGRTAALVSRYGSIDWLCLPRFDSDSIFAALLGSAEHGRWQVAPTDEVVALSRRYLPYTFVLETTFQTATGTAVVCDFMPISDKSAIVRRVRCTSGTISMRQEMVLRFGYGATMPWIHREYEQNEPVMIAIAGPDAVIVRGDNLPVAIDHRHAGTFDLTEGQSCDLRLQWFRSHHERPSGIDVDAALAECRIWWQDWAEHRDLDADYSDAVHRSLLVLRALTHRETGGIVAAASTSLPESPGGSRNWDYRYCWLRDASLTLEALLEHGYLDESQHWRRWLLRSVAGDPEDIQIMYGLAGERRLPERTLDHLPGYADSTPVRVGNGAVNQFQADVLGEVLVALDAARQAGVAETAFSWPLQQAMLKRVEETMPHKDSGIWESRGPLQYYVHSRVMIWAALDRGVKAVREYGMSGEADHWAELRDQMRSEIESSGFDADRGTYTQYYGSRGVDAALLQLPQVGFCAPDDERMLGTVAAIESELSEGGLVLRYRTEYASGQDGSSTVDGLTPGESPFMACSFWLVEQYARSGRESDARKLMDHLVSLTNDVGLMAEEYEPGTPGRQMGNMPQALSHLAMIRAADAIVGRIGTRGSGRSGAKKASRTG